ncbi:MAG: hypothetical protein ABFD89_12735 [Bryobacteraceae bacterium]
MKPRTYPGYIPRKRIRAVIRKKTGTLVSEQRIGRWINTGELQMLKVPSGCGYCWFTKDAWIEDLIRRYS